jgi:hypothetical protein
VLTATNDNSVILGLPEFFNPVASRSQYTNVFILLIIKFHKSSCTLDSIISLILAYLVCKSNPSHSNVAVVLHLELLPKAAPSISSFF